MSKFKISASSAPSSRISIWRCSAGAVALAALALAGSISVPSYASSGQVMVRPGEAPPTQGQAAATPPAAAMPEAEARAREVVALVDSGDAAAIAAYVARHVEPDAARGPGPPSTPAEFLARLHFQNKGAKLVGIRPVTASRVVARFESKLTGLISGVEVGVDPSNPSRIVSLSPRRPSVADASGLTTDQARVDRLADLAGKMAEGDYFSGTIMVARGENPIFSRSYGFANRETKLKNTADTRFQIASMNKMFTAVAIMQLVEKGKLSLDDKVSKFLPNFPDEESAKKITVRHLLTHTSGLGSYFGPAFFGRPPSSYRSLDDYLAVAGGGLAFEPGSRWSYSNTGMLVAGKIVEIVSGNNYYDYIRENIYKPAGMTRTDSYDPAKAKDRASSYEADFGTGRVLIQNRDAGIAKGSSAGGGYATANDLLRFSRAFRSGKLVKAETAQMMMSPQPNVGPPAYGLGLDLGARLAPPGRKIAGHGGDTPGACVIFDMILDTPEPYTVVILSNGTMMGNCHILAQQAYAVFTPPKP